MTVVKQIAVVLLGLVLAGVMVGLGIWQLDVYSSQGAAQARQRAAAPPVELTAVARPGQEAGDAYGRTVRFSGRYDASLQTRIAVPDQPGHYRVLTAFRLDSGGAVPVVRGVVNGKDLPPPPKQQLTQTGVLLPSEGTDRQAEPGAEPSTVALASLAQTWKVELVNGYATLGAAEAHDQSLQPATVRLPSSHGRLRNGFYALQWWVFAGFAVVMSIRMARDLGRAEFLPPDPAPVSDPEAPDRSDAGHDAGIDADPDAGSEAEPASESESEPGTDADPDAGTVPSPT